MKVISMSLYGRPCELHSHNYFADNCYWHGTIVDDDGQIWHVIEFQSGSLKFMGRSYSVKFTDKHKIESS